MDTIIFLASHRLFTRAWVVQEVAMARQSCIMLGLDKWLDFANVYELSLRLRLMGWGFQLDGLLIHITEETV